MSTLPTILITGANGQLGKEFRALENAYPRYAFIFTGREELDINDETAVNNFFTGHQIAVCVNCAAYTAVDKAETDEASATQTNTIAPGILARAAKTHSAAFIHISTDYVFDGTSTSPYKETDPVKPINVYGATKQKGEQLVMDANSEAIIIRTSWVYSAYGNNFVKTMLKLMKERESVNVVNDQVGSPTYAADLATAIMQIISSGNTGQPGASGIFHFSNTGVISWYDFAVAIRDLSGSKCIVNPIPAAQYPTPSKRPAYSVMDTDKIQTAFGIDIPGWKEALERCLQLL